MSSNNHRNEKSDDENNSENNCLEEQLDSKLPAKGLRADRPGAVGVDNSGFEDVMAAQRLKEDALAKQGGSQEAGAMALVPGAHSCQPSRGTARDRLGEFERSVQSKSFHTVDGLHSTDDDDSAVVCRNLKHLEDRVMAKLTDGEEEIMPESLNNCGAINMNAHNLMESDGKLQAPLECAPGQRPGFFNDSQAELEFAVVHVMESGLAVATAVEEDEGDHLPSPLDLPSAVEYDPNSKPALPRKRRYWVYGGLVAAAMVLITVGVVMGVVVGGDKKDTGLLEPTPAPTSLRARLGILDMIQSVVGAERLADAQGPYARALEWLINDDPLMLTPDNDTFYQRYFAAYLYFATSEDRPWASCSPAGENETTSCLYQELLFSNSVRESYYWGKSPYVRWLSDQSECNWAGVRCDENGQIRRLNLAGMNTTGSFPEGITFFPYLQAVSLVSGMLQGTIPSALASMKSLQTLVLRINEFTGRVPTELWTMYALNRIDLGQNHLTGSFPREAAERIDMKTLLLFDNKLLGTIPTEVGLMKSVFDFQADTNRLTGTIPTEFGQIVPLRSFWLHNNLLNGSIPSELAQKPRNVESIKFSSNTLNGTIPTEIYTLSNLNLLLLDNNNLVGTLSSLVGNMTKLVVLSMENNMMSGTIPTEYGEMTNLNSLTISGNNFTGTVPQALCTLRSGQFVTLVADCSPDIATGLPEIYCPTSCCSRCCDSTGTFCLDT